MFGIKVTNPITQLVDCSSKWPVLIGCLRRRYRIVRFFVCLFVCFLFVFSVLV